MIDPTDPDFENSPVSERRPRYAYELAGRPEPSLVTIVTPFFNAGPVFRETVDSVQRQSFQQWEWVIVNDGSTNSDALALLAEYERAESRIRIIHHPHNRGLSAARNSGFAAATTEYVVQLDSDDLLERTAVEKWWWFLITHPQAAFVKGFSIGFGAVEYVWSKGFHHGRSFLEENLVNATSMIRRSAHQAIGGYDETMKAGLEDWDFWLRSASIGNWGTCIPEFLDWYRRRTNHTDRWEALSETHIAEFLARSRVRHPELWSGGFPRPILVDDERPRDSLAIPEGDANRLRKHGTRLLILASPFGDDRHTEAVVREMVARGIEVSVVLLRSDIRAASAYARHTPDVFTLPNFVARTDYPRFLQYLVASRQIDGILVADSEWGWPTAAYLRATSPRLACVHIGDEGSAPRHALTIASVDRDNHPVDAGVVRSELERQELAASGVRLRRIRVSRALACVEVDHISEEARAKARAAMHVPPSVPVFVFADVLDAEGQPFLLARTVQLLREKSSNWIAVIAGDGPDLDWLYGFIARHDLTRNVRIVSGGTSEDVRSLLIAADVYFHPSQRESPAPALLTAMSLGLPIVGESVGVLGDVMIEPAGVLVARSDEDTQAAAYAAALEDLLSTPERARALGRAAARIAQRLFSAHALGAQLQALVAEVMLDRAGSTSCQEDPVAAERWSRSMIKVARLLRRTEHDARVRWDRQRELIERQGAVMAESRELVNRLEKRLLDADRHAEIMKRDIDFALFVQSRLREELEALAASKWVRLGRFFALLATARTPP